MKLLKDILYKVAMNRVVGSTNVAIQNICFDSREVGQFSVFVAIRGTQSDGHDFIQQTVEKGVLAVVCEEIPEETAENVTYIETKDSNSALALMACNFYNNPSDEIKLIGITGTNGKTTTVTILHQLFMNLGHKCGLLSTVVNKIQREEIPSTHTTPNPLELNRLLRQMVDEECTHCFMEVSSHALVQRRTEGVNFKTNQNVGVDINPDDLINDYDAVILSGGAEWPRDLPVPGRDLKGVHFAMDFLPSQNKVVAGDKVEEQILATDKHVIVIGGGDTGSDCVGTSNRHGAKSVTQFELMPQPPEKENKAMVWPYWPLKLRTSSSHEEGCQRDWSVATKELIGENGVVKELVASRVEWKDGKMAEVANSEFKIKADLVLLAMGFVGPQQNLLEKFGIEKDERGNAKAETEGEKAYFTSRNKVFAAGDMRRGQSLVVWAIREGRQCARAVDEFLMGSSILPR